MKRTKMEKGITLIALIITIVVLLILAAVAISSITNDGILHYATNAADAWNRAQENEATQLQNYLGYLNQYGNGGGTTPPLEEEPTPPVGETTVPTAPTAIEGVSVSGANLTVKATGGTAEAGVKGYKYSVNGTNWSETLLQLIQVM